MSGTPDSKFRVSNTSKFGVIDPASSKVVHVTAKPADAAAPAAAASGAKADHKTRLTKSTGKLVDEAGKGRIGGPFTVTKDPTYLKDRLSVFAAAVERQKERHAAKPRVPITVTLPDGSTREGTSWVTTPMDIAAGISKQMAKTVSTTCYICLYMYK
jgi:threonyl-tRNA synthetase